MGRLERVAVGVWVVATVAGVAGGGIWLWRAHLRAEPGMSEPAPDDDPMAAARVAVASDRAPVVVTAERLAADYHANAVTADDRYLRRILLVGGVVDRVERLPDRQGIAVYLRGAGYDVVRCLLEDTAESADAARHLRQGRRAQFRGLGAGTYATDPVVVLCRLDTWWE